MENETFEKLLSIAVPIGVVIEFVILVVF